MITKLSISVDRENYSLSFDVQYVNITGIAVEQRPTVQKMLYQQLSILKVLTGFFMQQVLIHSALSTRGDVKKASSI